MFEILIDRAAEKDLRRLAPAVRERAEDAILDLARNPRPAGAKKLTGSKSDWRIRVGDYRVLYEITDTIRVVRVFRVRHRGDVYR
ncbi:type II toxin-antitoxin system RelE/ParE family toxin [Prosthecobacter sp.]|uniref:type II toxin-antitoxin system RelE/ParE family toxin n=1 Tax=Prosthecobacter sp. TaxID=1965333 RepID=UPI0037839505